MDQSLAKIDKSALAAIIGQENLDEVNNQFAGGISGGDYLPQVSIRGNRFRLKIGGEETALKEMHIDVFLVNSRPNVSKVYYEKGYDPGAESHAPDCSSMDGHYPDANVENKQAENCQICPNNAWGSKITQSGKKGKACSDHKLIVLALAQKPDQAFAMRIPAASLKPFGAYIQKLSLAGVPADAAKTRISLGDTEFPSLEFDFAGTVDTKEQYETLRELAESAEVLNAVQIAPRAAPAAEPVVHKAEQPVVAPVEEVKPEPEPEEGETSLSDLLGTKPAVKKKAEPKKKAKPEPEPVAEEEEDADQITSLDQLLGKLKK